MSLDQLTTLDAIKQFLDGTQTVAFNVAADKSERYRWVQKTLLKHRYLQLGKTERTAFFKIAVIHYLMKVTDYSLAQTQPVLEVGSHLQKTGCIRQ